MKLKSILKNHMQKRKIARDLYGTRMELSFALRELENVYTKPLSEQKKDEILNEFQLSYEKYKCELLENRKYPLPVNTNEEFIDDIEKIQIISLKDCKKFIELILNIQEEKIKLHGSKTNSFYAPILGNTVNGKGSISLMDAIVVIIVLGSVWLVKY